VRLDHLLSKEHLESQVGPHCADLPVLGESMMAYPCSGGGSGAQRATKNLCWSPIFFGVGVGLPGTLLGFEATGPRVSDVCVGVPASARFGVGVHGCCRSILVVGCGV
jgi:hypothetical protein